MQSTTRYIGWLRMALTPGVLDWQLALCHKLHPMISGKPGISWVSSLQEVTTDPLVQYCEDTPEADECRVYED